MSDAWDNFVEEHPWAVEVATNYGTRLAELNGNLLNKWKKVLADLFEAESQDGITLKEEVEFKSPLNAALWDAWRMTSRDPEQYIGQWAREGVPLGMDLPVPSSGIY